jgi:predicted Rossmann fold nucleotide-binding protein DprA/Smf involved in DNA uptake
LIVLITGSRQTTPNMLAAARKVVEIAKNQGWTIIVGDAPGVDAEVIQACDVLGVPVEMHGAYNELRFRTHTGKNHWHPGPYSDRDRIMVELCDRCIAIWNGKSKGTLDTAKAAKRLGKPTQVFRF